MQFDSSVPVNFLLDSHDSSLMYMCYQKGVVFLGCGQFLPSLLSVYWVISAYFLAVLEISICAY